MLLVAALILTVFGACFCWIGGILIPEEDSLLYKKPTKMSARARGNFGLFFTFFGLLLNILAVVIAYSGR